MVAIGWSKQRGRATVSRFLHAERTLTQTTGFSPEERQAIIDLLKETATGVNAVDTIHAAVLTQLGVRDFTWPEFDRWQAFFAERRKFPPLWDHVQRVPPARASLEMRHAYQRQKLYLLLDSLFNLENTRTALTRYAKQAVRVEIARQGTGASCPVCDALERREVTDRSHDLPPFHPGCRCVVVALEEKRPQSRRPLSHSV